MSDISHLLESALGNEPGYTPDLGAIVSGGRRRRRRQRVTVAGSGVAVAAGIGALVTALVSTGSPGALTGNDAAPVGSDSPLTGRPSATAPVRNHGITASNLAASVERDAGIRLSGVSVSVLPPAADIDLAAGIASARGQYLNVQVVSAAAPLTPTCADLSGNGPDGDGYTGPCTVSRQSGGGRLVVRSGRTANGRYAITQANLFDPDGSAILAEATNQANGGLKLVRGSTNRRLVRIPPVVSHDPPLTGTDLRRLVLALNAQR